MVSIEKIRQLLPPYKGKQVLITNNQDTKDIINLMVNSHLEYKEDYDQISHLFDLWDVYDACAAIWNFLKFQLFYKAEPIDYQSAANPSAIVHTGFTVDCKHLSLFSAGVVDSLCRLYEFPGTWAFRFVSESRNKDITHVFVVVFVDGKEIWIDPVLSTFDQRRDYTFIKDRKIKSSQIAGLYKISGLGQSVINWEVSVNKAVAEQSFLVMVLQNVCGIKNILKNDRNFLNNIVRPWYTTQGYDFNQLLLIIQ